MLSEHLTNKLNGLRTKSLLIGIAGVAVAVLGGLLAAFTGEGAGLEKVFQPFLVAFVLVLGLSVGGLAALMLHHLCGGAWSFMIQRILEAASRTLVFVAGLAVVVLLGGVWFTHLYPWTSEEYLHTHHIVELKTGFLNKGMFTLCTLGYFGIWLTLMYFFNTWSKKLDETGDLNYIAKMKFWAGPGLVLYVLTITVAATHWIMSLEPDWYSTIYGAWLIAGINITIVSFAVIMLLYLSGEAPISEKLTTRHLHHLGTFLCGFVIFWSYVSFAQFLLIWNANLPEEIGWYLHRQGGGLTGLSIVLMVFHWFIPMMYLFIRNNKKDPGKLRRAAIYLLIVRVLDLYWNIVPSFEGNHSKLSILTFVLVLAAVAGVVGLWLWYFLGQLKQRSLLAVRDPRHEFSFLKDEAHSHA